MKNHIFLFLIFALLFSCTKTIDFDDEGFANQVIVNSVITTGDNFTAYLTLTSSILENRVSNPPAEGSLDLYEDGTLIRQFPTQLGAFSDTNIKPKAGKSYRIVINSNGKTLEAETTIPNRVEVISIDTTSVKNEFGQKTPIYKVKIKDPTGGDYYRIVVMNETLSKMTFIDSEKKKTTAYYLQKMQYSILSDDPVFKSVYTNFGDDLIDFAPYNDYYIFPDDYFQGKEYTIRFRISNFGYHYYNPYDYGNPSNPNSGNGIIYERNTIHIQRLSKDLYNYLKYLKLYDHYRDNPFAEPVPVYSNVKKGVGIFAGFNDETKFTFEKIFIPFSMDTIQVEENSYPPGYK